MNFDRFLTADPGSLSRILSRAAAPPANMGASQAPTAAAPTVAPNDLAAAAAALAHAAQLLAAALASADPRPPTVAQASLSLSPGALAAVRPVGVSVAELARDFPEGGGAAAAGAG